MLPYFWLHKLLPAHFLRPTVSLFLVQKLYCLRSLPLLQCNSRLHYNLTGFATPSDHFCFLSPQRPVSFPSVHVNYRNQAFYCYSSLCGNFGNCQPECSQGFLYTGIKKKKNGGTNEQQTTEKDKTGHNMSEHLLYSVYMPQYMSEYGGSESIC